MAAERPTQSSYRIHQTMAIRDLAREHGLANCKPTLLPYNPGIAIDDASTAQSAPADTSVVRSILGSVNYFVTMTCPEVAYALNRLQRHAHHAKQEHLAQARHLVSYLNHAARTSQIGLHYEGNASRWRTSPNDGLLKIEWQRDGFSDSNVFVFNLHARLDHDVLAYSDSDWAADTDDRRSRRWRRRYRSSK